MNMSGALMIPPPSGKLLQLTTAEGRKVTMVWRLLVFLHCMGDNPPIGIWKILAGFSELLIDTKEKRT